MRATPTKRDQIVDELRRRILSGDLQRGTHIPQNDLARQFGASITPVREALRQLEAEGLVTALPHRAVRVAGVDLDQVTANYVLRRLTETFAMKRATLRVSRRDIARARELLDDAGEPGKPLAAFRECNTAFHFLFYDRCEMPALTERISTMWEAFPWDLMLTSPARSAACHDEHLAMLAAVETGDPEAVAATTATHIENGYVAILEQLTGKTGPDPFDLNS